MSAREGHLFAGLMSGTSMDAVDGAIVSLAAQARVLTFASLPIPSELRSELRELQAGCSDELHRAALAAAELADLYGEVVELLLAQSGLAAPDVRAIGAHGQTLRHRPEVGYTLQILNAARLAERAGIDVVADFRSADVAAGGQGAPLVPAFHASVFGHATEARAVINLGGIANVSLLPAGIVGTGTITGFDTGPANTLLDLWCQQHRSEPFDRDGQWAASGTVHAGLLARMLAEPYFSRAAPKSTGQDLFARPWLDAMLGATGEAIAARDVQATLAELTAHTVAQACRAGGAATWWVCGGGARNADLMRRLRRLAGNVRVADTGELGIDPQAVEAAAFAWLARQRIEREPGNLASVTDAEGPRVLGAVWPGRGR